MTNRFELLEQAARAEAQRQPLDAAVLYERAGDLERAIALYTRGGVPTRAAQLLEAAGRAPQAAALLTSLGRHLDAAAVHERAHDHAKAAAALLRGGQRERAAAMFERAEAWSDAAKLYASLGNHERAAQLLEAAGDPGRAALLRAEAATPGGDAPVPAAPVELAPGEVMDAGQLVAAVVALLGAGRVDEASRLYASSHEDVGYSILAAVAGGGPRQQAAARMFEAARDFAKAGECLEGLEDYAGAGALYERADDAFMAAEMYLRAGDRERAALMLERSGNPGKAAELFEAAGTLDRAAACHEKAGHLLAAGLLYGTLGNPGKALHLLQRVPREDAGWLRASRAVGELLAAHGQPAVAIGRYDEALQGATLGEQTAPLYSHLATCLEQVGDVGRAASVLRQLAAWRADFEDAGRRLLALQGRVAAPAPPRPASAPAAADAPAPNLVAARLEGFEVLQRQELFQALSLAQLRDLHARCEPRRYGAGERLAEAGEKAGAIHLVCRGTVRLEGPDAQGDQAIGSSGPGTLLGLVNFLGDAPCPARLVADGEVEVLAIPAARFTALLAADDQLALRVYRNASKALAARLLALLPAATLLALCLAALGPGLAAAQDPCASDVQRLCSDVQVGNQRVVGCLKEHEPELTVGCRDRLASDALRARKTIARFGQACMADMEAHCPGIRPGGGRVLQCLGDHRGELSPACQAETASYVEARERIAAIRGACTADAERLCQGVPPRAGPLVECLQAKEARLSAGCGAAEIRRAAEAASLVDTIEEMTREDRVKEALEVLQGIDAVAFSRSQIQFQYDSFNDLGGRATASRFTFNPQFVFGGRGQYSLQLKVPALTLYPLAAGAPTQSGVAVVTTAFAWAFSFHGQVGQYLAIGLQSPVAGLPGLGGPWTVAPSYALAAGLARWLSLTTQVTWLRSFDQNGYPAVNLALLEPILVVKLPSRAFAVLDTKLAWSLNDGSFTPVMKGVVGLFLDRPKSVSVSAWYQASLTSAAVSRSFDYGVGVGLAYFFDL